MISVVILSYNVKDLLKKAIKSVYKTYKNPLQLVVVDNASSDGTISMIKKEFPEVNLVISKKNVGFSKGNNLARKKVKGDKVLFLNPDTKVQKNAINKCEQILKNRAELAAITCKVMLPNGQIDYSCHRGLPNVWNTFSYWTKLSKIFHNSKLFSGYEASFLDTDESHFIDCISGTFLMIRRNILDEIGWWDEDYWWNGEDIEMCYSLKQKGYKIWYESSVTTIHYKGASSGLWNTNKMNVKKETKIKSARSASKAMKIFVEKHWKELGPASIMIIVRLGIVLLERYRLWKINAGKSYK